MEVYEEQIHRNFSLFSKMQIYLILQDLFCTQSMFSWHTSEVDLNIFENRKIEIICEDYSPARS